MTSETFGERNRLIPEGMQSAGVHAWTPSDILDPYTLTIMDGMSEAELEAVRLGDASALSDTLLELPNEGFGDHLSPAEQRKLDEIQ